MSNYVYGSNWLLVDGGSIYVLGPQPNSVMASNFISNQRQLYGALYTDEGSAYWYMTNNVVHDVPEWLVSGRVPLPARSLARTRARMRARARAHTRTHPNSATSRAAQAAHLDELNPRRARRAELERSGESGVVARNEPAPHSCARRACGAANPPRSPPALPLVPCRSSALGAFASCSSAR